ncbi:MAG: hypothetical protein NUK65_11975, partial [Firmicutes bacterium]|nr:hypothetical protein [Bacillota bacterium]
MTMQKGYYGLATGIGSFPYKTPAPALDLLFRSVPALPHWPQLPAIGNQEGLVRQYLSPLLARGLVVETEGRAPYFVTETSNWLAHLTAFYTDVLDNTTQEVIDTFSFPPAVAAGYYAFLQHLHEQGPREARYIKGQLTGPLTTGIVVTDEKMQPAFYHDDLRDVIVRSLALQIRWQARSLQQFGVPVMLFLDEPGLYGYGQATFVGLSRQAIQESLLTLIEVAHEEGVSVGIHACAGIDWSLLFELPFDVINIDVYHYFTSLLLYAEQCNSYLTRGGAIAWGIVPTSPEVANETG